MVKNLVFEIQLGEQLSYSNVSTYNCGKNKILKRKPYTEEIVNFYLVIFQNFNISISAVTS